MAVQKNKNIDKRSVIISEQDRPVFKDFQLAGRAKASVNLGTGESIFTINDVKAENSVMGVAINHVYCGENGKLDMGEGFQLSLEESLVFESNVNAGYSYLYTDGKGQKYAITEYFYYIDETGNKVYVDTPKSQILVSGDGRYFEKASEYWNTFQQGQELFVEHKSAIGCKAELEVKNLLNSDAKLSNNEELRKAKETIVQYEKELFSYHSIARGPGEDMHLSNYCDSVAKFQYFIEASIDMDFVLLRDDQVPLYRNMNNVPFDFMNADYQNIEYVKKLYSHYAVAKEKLRQLETYTPINFLSDGTITKGFNSKGKLVSISDSNDNVVVVEYKTMIINSVEQERIERLLASTGEEARFEYAKDGKLYAIVDANGHRTEYLYNENKLVEIKKPNGEKYILGYTSGKLASIQEENTNKIATITYGENGEIVEIKAKFDFGIDKNGKFEIANTTEKIVRFTKSVVEDKTNVFIEDVENKVIEKYTFNQDSYLKAFYVQKDGVVTRAEEYEYVPYYIGKVAQENPREVLRKASKESLHKTSLENFVFVEEEGYVATLNEDGNVVQKTYSPIYIDGEKTNRKIQTVEYFYSKDKKLTEEKITTTYDSLPEKQEIKIIKYFYNQIGDLIKKTVYVQGEENLYGKNIEEWIYDDKGNLTKTFRYNSLDSTSKYCEEYTYDEKGKVSAERSQTGESETEFIYSGDKITEQKLPNGSKFAFGYDENRRVNSVSHSTDSGEANSTEKVYNNGMLTMLSSGNNKVEYSYDNKRRLISIGLNGTENYAVTNHQDNLILDGKTVDKTTTTNAKGESESVVVDKKGNVLKQERNGNTKATFVYNENNMLSSKQDFVTGETHNYVYDQKFAEKEHNFGAYSTQKTFDLYHNLTALDFKKNNTPLLTYQYAYTDDSKKRRKSTTVAGISESYEYDALGRVKKTVTTAGENSFAKVRNFQKVGDHTTDRVVALYYLKNGVSDTKFTYTYDNMGNVISISENGVQKSKYEYDLLNRLVKETDIAKGIEICYTIDNEGNILTKSTNGERKEYKYLDGSDKLVSFGGENFVYDAIGNPTTYRNKTLSWENGRELKSYQDGENLYTYTYDSNSFRKTKTVNGQTTTYVYENGKLLREERASQSIDYLYGADGIIGIKVNETVYLFRKNIFGDVTEIYDTNGALIGKYSYTAYGECSIDLQENSVVSINPIRYRSYYYDSETNLYYLKSRYYDPETGRFITIDDTSYIMPDEVNGLNLYAYCADNPVMNVDPNGTFLLGLVVGVLLLGTALVVTAVESTGEEHDHTLGDNKIVISDDGEKASVYEESASIYEKKLYHDEEETQSVYIAVGNIDASIGMDKNLWGLFFDASILDIGYEGKYISGTISFGSTGYKIGLNNSKFDAKFKPFKFIDFDISVNFSKIVKVIIGE